MMTISRKRIIERTLFNLEYINTHKADVGPYEVTQLVNSFLMTLLHNWDEIKDDWPHLPQGNVKWPKLRTSKKNQQARQCIKKIRDALAHGCFVFGGPENGEIECMNLWTCDKNSKIVDWNVTISIADMRAMLDCFVELAKNNNLPNRQARKKGDICL